MKLAVAQVFSSDNKEENFVKAEKYIKKAKEQGADFIVFPEHYMSTLSETSELNQADIAETIDGSFITRLSNVAKENQIYVMCGIYEHCPGDQLRSYNSVVTINKEGEVIDCYRKTHLFDAFNSKESDQSIPGSKPPSIINTEYGKIGIMICYELRFPEIARYLTLKGADLILVPTAWKHGILKEHHWNTLLKARAIENTVFIAGVDQIGKNNVGNSTIIDPMGVPVASAGENETLVFSNIDTNRLGEVRKKLPSLEHRVFESLFS